MVAAEAEAMVAAEAGAAAEAGVLACVCRHVRGAHYNALSSRSNFCSLSAISPWIAADSYMALMAAAASGLSWLSVWYCPRIASFWACAGGRMAETGQPWLWPALPHSANTPTPRPPRVYATLWPACACTSVAAVGAYRVNLEAQLVSFGQNRSH